MMVSFWFFYAHQMVVHLVVVKAIGRVQHYSVVQAIPSTGSAI